jgi:hypothetical protein
MEAGEGGIGVSLARPLCVACRHCGRRRAFGSTSPEARRPDAATLPRLVCGGCGARGAEGIRLSDDREAARWLRDR